MPTHFPLRRWFSGRTQCLRPLTPAMRRLTILLGVLAGAQLLFLFWLNLTQLRYHLGYDASCDYLRAAEMYRQGKLFPDHWRDTTTSHLDSRCRWPRWSRANCLPSMSLRLSAKIPRWN